MSKINFLKPDQSNLNTFLYLGSFLFFISILDVFLNSFFKVNITGFLPGFLSFIIPLLLGFVGLFFIRIEYSGIKKLDLINDTSPEVLATLQQRNPDRWSRGNYEAVKSAIIAYIRNGLPQGQGPDGTFSSDGSVSVEQAKRSAAPKPEGSFGKFSILV